MRFQRHQDGRRWELHHSDKVCELRFARIQGREALIQEHQKQFAKHGHRKSRPVVATPLRTARDASSVRCHSSWIRDMRNIS